MYVCGSYLGAIFCGLVCIWVCVVCAWGCGAFCVSVCVCGVDECGACL